MYTASVYMLLASKAQAYSDECILQRPTHLAQKANLFLWGPELYVEVRQLKALHPTANGWTPIDGPSLSRLSLAVPTTIMIDSPEHVENRFPARRLS